jgi:hypothetical protein
MSAMVRHYAKEVLRHHVAINAMKKLETGWSEIRKERVRIRQKGMASALLRNRNRTGIGNQRPEIGNYVGGRTVAVG